MGGGEGGDAQPEMMDYIMQGQFRSKDLRQEARSSRYPERKRKRPTRFEDEVSRRTDEGLIRKIKEKLKKIQLEYPMMRFMFNPTCASNAYTSLDVCSDAKGLSTIDANRADSTCVETDIEWLTLLARLVNHSKIKVMSFENNYHINTLTSDLSLSQENIDECVENYYDVYYDKEKAADWERLKNFLLTPDAEVEYNRDLDNFKPNLKKCYGAVPFPELSSVIEAFVSWWLSKSKEEEAAKKEEEAKKLITRIYEKAQDFCDNRMERFRGYTRLDYLKLKSGCCCESRDYRSCA